MATINEMIQVTPTPQQYAWQQIEFFGFIHFGMNTMNDVEWGDGSEDPAIFNPTNVDCYQWVKSFKDAGMKGAILTCKHHDGFCLWPSKYTKHSVESSPWKDGKGDLVAEFAQACHDLDMKFGVYLSPWDRAEGSYGQGKAYDDYFVNHLEELLTNYGDVFEVWFDGANGEGPNGKVQEYDWKRYYATIHRLQPDAVIAISGPDVRWVGNEAGKTRANEWSVVPIHYANPNYVAEHSQQEDDGVFSQQFNQKDEDLGSTERLQNFSGQLIWYPAEVDTSIRPGWFHHSSEDDKVRSPEELFSIYKHAVGGNCALILNVPPNCEGQFSQNDLNALQTLGQYIEQLKSMTISVNSKYSASSNQELLNSAALDSLDLSETDWHNEIDDLTPELSVQFSEPVELNTLIIKENILKSQRVEEASVYYLDKQDYKKLATIGTIGYQKILEFDSIETTEIVVKFEKFRSDSIYIQCLKVGHLV